MNLEEKAKSVIKYFGREHQELKFKEEKLELQIALMELSKFVIKNNGSIIKNGTTIEYSNLYENCNDELADNIFLRMQLRKDTFEYCYDIIVSNYTEKTLKNNYYLENFTFGKEEVRRICCEKADRTILRYNIKVEW